MFVWIYDTAWIVTIAGACIALALTNFNVTVAIVFGFILIALVFEGMMSVLPAIVSQAPPPKPPL